MTLYADLDLSLKIKQDPGALSDLVKQALSLNQQAYDEMAVDVREVANGAVDQAVNFQGVATAGLVLLLADGTLTFKLNGVSTGFAATALLVNGAALTSLTVSNSSGATVNLEVILVGN